ncbi:MAG: hypothetical protein NUV77_16295, partial [Thermoguttaceae bacterium]|nr:hypothetical protein [Thermoguttaceae bacterium]
MSDQPKPGSPRTNRPNRPAVLFAALCAASLAAPGPCLACRPDAITSLATSMLAQRSKLDEEEEEESVPRAKQSPPTPAPSKAASPENAASAIEKPLPAARAEPQEPHEEVCDWLYRRPEGGGGGWVRIRLLSDDLGLLQGKQRYEFALYPRGRQALLGSEIGQVEYYEHRMLVRAARTAGIPADDLSKPDAPVPLADARSLRAAGAADAILRRAVSEHDSAVQRGLRQAADFRERLRRPLIHARVNLRLGMIDAMLARSEYSRALEACERLTADLGRDEPALGPVHRRVQRIYGLEAREAARSKDYARARELLGQLAGRSPDPNDLGPEAAAVRNELIALATASYREGERLRTSAPAEDAAAMRAAAAKFDEAARIWPRLPGLERAQQLLRAKYQVLRCAYPELPRDLCPFWCRTPVERHAVALVCEGLVRWVDDGDEGARYEPQLAEGRPQPLPRGRRFELPHCFWPAQEPRSSAQGDPTAENA